MDDRTLRVALKQAGPIPLDVAFECAPGQVLALFGPSGSGKTTVLRSIAGLYAPASATVRCGSETWLDRAAGIDVAAHRRRVGFVFQDYALFPHLTALGNVMAAMTRRPRDERRGRARDLLRLVHLDHRMESRPAALSGGERQRVAVARALAREPRVLLLDEPFAAVDRPLRRALHAEIDDIRRAFDIPILLVTHDFDDVVRMATDLVVVRSGQVAAAGAIEALTSRPDLPWLRDMVGLGSVVDATVGRIDQSRGLAELEFGGGVLLAPAKDLRVGARVRIRIPAREVILASEAPRGLSLHNMLRGLVSGVEPDPDGRAVVQLQVGGSFLLAEVTVDAVARLGIVKGLELYALVKSVSLEVRSAGPDA